MNKFASIYKNEQFLLFTILLIGFLLRFKLCNDSFLHAWDERFHALVAKNLQRNFLEPRLYIGDVLELKSIDWRYSTIWLHKQPLTLWVIAVSLKIFGITVWTVRLPSLLLSTISILLTFKIAKQTFNKNIGLVAAFFQAVNGLLIEISSGRVATDHVDLFYMFFIELAILLVIQDNSYKNRYSKIIIGVVIGLAVLVKWLPAYIVLLLFFVWNYNKCSFLENAKNCLFIFLVSFLVFIPWQIFCYLKFPTYYSVEQLNNINHFFYTLDGQGGHWWYYLSKIRTNYHDLIYIPLVWFFYNTYLEKDIKKLFYIVWIAIPLVFFSVCATKMQGYILFISPALFIILALFINHFWIMYKHKNWIKTILVLSFLIPIVIYNFDRVWLKKYDNEEVKVCQLKSYASLFNENKAIVFNNSNYIETMFYFKCNSYDFFPTDLQIEKLKSQNYKLYYFENKDVYKLRKL